MFTHSRITGKFLQQSRMYELNCVDLFVDFPMEIKSVKYVQNPLYSPPPASQWRRISSPTVFSAQPISYNDVMSHVIAASITWDVTSSLEAELGRLVDRRGVAMGMLI